MEDAHSLRWELSVPRSYWVNRHLLGGEPALGICRRGWGGAGHAVLEGADPLLASLLSNPAPSPTRTDTTISRPPLNSSSWRAHWLLRYKPATRSGGLPRPLQPRLLPLLIPMQEPLETLPRRCLLRGAGALRFPGDPCGPSHPSLPGSKANLSYSPS